MNLLEHDFLFQCLLQTWIPGETRSSIAWQAPAWRRTTRLPLHSNVVSWLWCLVCYMVSCFY